MLQSALEAIDAAKEENEKLKQTVIKMRTDATEQTALYEQTFKMNKNAYILTNILLPIPSVAIMCVAAAPSLRGENNNLSDAQKACLYTGLGTLLVSEAIYQCGHWIFKWF